MKSTAEIPIFDLLVYRIVDQRNAKHWEVVHYVFLLALSVTAKAEQSTRTEQTVSHQRKTLAQIATGSIFVYGPGFDPCAPSPAGQILIPYGSAFVVGLRDKKTATPELWSGWKFLITAKHVIASHSDVIIRLNTANVSSFVCHSLTLETDGLEENVVFAPAGIDLVAVAMPDIPETDPATFDAASNVLVD